MEASSVRRHPLCAGVLVCFDIGYKDSLDNVEYKVSNLIQVMIFAELDMQWNVQLNESLIRLPSMLVGCKDDTKDKSCPTRLA